MQAINPISTKAAIGYPNVRNRVQSGEPGNRKNIKYTVKQQKPCVNLNILSDFFSATSTGYPNSDRFLQDEYPVSFF